MFFRRSRRYRRNRRGFRRYRFAKVGLGGVRF